jgi:hypothetical protein
VADSVEISIIQFNQKTKTDEETVTVTSNSFYLEMVQGRVSLRGKGRLMAVCVVHQLVSASLGWTLFVATKKNRFTVFICGTCHDEECTNASLPTT